MLNKMKLFEDLLCVHVCVYEHTEFGIISGFKLKCIPHIGGVTTVENHSNSRVDNLLLE